MNIPAEVLPVGVQVIFDQVGYVGSFERTIKDIVVDAILSEAGSGAITANGSRSHARDEICKIHA